MDGLGPVAGASASTAEAPLDDGDHAGDMSATTPSSTLDDQSARSGTKSAGAGSRSGSNAGQAGSWSMSSGLATTGTGSSARSGMSLVPASKWAGTSAGQSGA